MATIEDKVKLFNKVIFETILEEAKREKEKVERIYTEETKKLKEDMEQKLKNTIDEAKNKAEEERQKTESKAGLEEHHAVLKKKEEFLKIITEEIVNRVKEYTSQPEYLEFLRQNISNANQSFKGEQSLSFIFTVRDLSTYGDYIYSTISSLAENSNFKIFEGPQDMLGGCVVENAEKTLRIDSSLSTIIKDSNELIGETLAKRLGEVAL